MGPSWDVATRLSPPSLPSPRALRAVVATGLVTWDDGAGGAGHASMFDRAKSLASNPFVWALLLPLLTIYLR